MAALLGALPLMLGRGTGSELRHPLGITIVGGLIVSQLLTLFTTPVIYLYFDRLAARSRAWGRARRPRRARRRRDEPLRALHPPAGGDHAADRRRRPRRASLAYIHAAGGAAAAGGFPDHLGHGAPCRAPARRPWPPRVATPLERHLGQIADVTEMTSSSSIGSTQHHAAVRPEPRHRRRRPRRAGGDQRGARRPADRAAQQSDLPQGQPGRRADHDPGAHLGDPDARADLRRADTILPQKLSQVKGVGQVSRRQLAAGGAGGAQSQRAVQVRHRPGGRARRARRRPTPTRPRARSTTAAERYQIYTNDQAARPREYST